MKQLMEIYTREDEKLKTNVPSSYEEISPKVLRGKYYIWENMPQSNGEIFAVRAFISANNILQIVLVIYFDVGYLPYHGRFQRC